MSTSIPPVNGAIAPVGGCAPPAGVEVDAFERCMAGALQDTPADPRADAADTKRRDGDASPERSDAPPARDRPDDAPREVHRHHGGARQRADGRDDDTAPALLPAHALVAPWAAPPIASNLAAAKPADAGSGWAQLSAHLERLLIDSGPQGLAGRPAAMFTLSGELLADTSVSLTRTDGGWLLRIQSSDPLLRADSKRHEAALRKRFADRGLGELIVEQV